MMNKMKNIPYRNHDKNFTNLLAFDRIKERQVLINLILIELGLKEEIKDNE